ncbi:YhbY family RNA-binding protein, partial [Acidithiobacillus ferridurans]
MLDAKHRQALRGQAHALKPVVIIGAHGITDAVLAELEVAIHAHELVKV